MHDVFLSKFDPSCTFQWVKTWGGTSQAYGCAVTIGGSTNPYVTGHFMGTCDFCPGPGAEIYSSGDSIDVFLSKFDTNGAFQWARTWGSNEHLENAYGNGVVATDGLGNAYVAGDFGGTVDFDPGPYHYYLDSTPNASGQPTTDVFLSKFPPDGNW
jgi:hypothetical protein